ncbi:hypothetical protein BH11VER1_BH11VER1_22270 [soil metagenome]
MRKVVSICLLALLACPLSAQNAEPYPESIGKKGLQVQMVPDAIALGIQHAGINVSLGSLMDVQEEPDSLRIVCAGRTYFVHQRYVQSLDAQIKPLSDAGVVVNLILLAYPTKNPAKDVLLLHPKAKADGKYNISAFNTATEAGLMQYQALVEFLAERYSGAHPEHGRVWGYIIGNEVNSQWMWYNLGKMPLLEVVSEYEKAVRGAQSAISKHLAHARVYLSFDHHWNTSMPGISDQEAYKGKDFLDAFARIARERGDFEWHVAHHPYADDLGNPRTWNDKQAWPTEDSPHITFKNLEVACKYMEKPEILWKGAVRRIILSEQGLHCLGSAEGETLQAAGFAYVWEKVMRQKGIDALIWHRQVDHAHEGGLRLGLWENKPGTVSEPNRPRHIYELFKKAGTPEWRAAAEFALPIVGLKNWDELK